MRVLMVFFLSMSLGLMSAWPESPGGRSWAAVKGPTTSSLSGLAASPRPGLTVSPDQMRVIVLEPFYLFREKHGRVQVERAIVTLEILDREKEGMVDWRGEVVRSAFYQIFHRSMDEASQQQQAQELLRRKFGQQEPATVKITRSLLLLP